MLRTYAGPVGVARGLLYLVFVMCLTSLRDGLVAIAIALLLAFGPLFVAEGASALEPLLTMGADSFLPRSGMPSLLLGLGALLALAFYGRPRSDP